jgi:hypothetical protein
MSAHADRSRACHAGAANASSVRPGNPEKKGIFATREYKKALAKACACAIFRADSLHARAPRADRNTKSLEE